MGAKASHPVLNEIYVPLATMAAHPESTVASSGRRTRPKPPAAELDPERALLTAVEFIALHTHAVILGDPGSGKSTFANMLALAMASELLGQSDVGLKNLGDGWSGKPLVPVRVGVRQFAVAGDASITDPADRLWRFFEAGLPGTYRSEFARLLRKHFAEEGGLFIIDGYDEAPETERHRERVRESVRALRGAFPRCRVLVTSRVYAYQHKEDFDWRLPEFTDATLASFTAEQQDEFVDRWYAYCARYKPGLTGEIATGRAAQLKATLHARRDLRPLAERPLLLTLMASLHAWRQGNLPSGREGLYEESVKLLLEQWERPKTVIGSDGKPRLVTKSAAAFLEAEPARIYDALQRLAFEAHRDQEKPEREADIPQSKLVEALYVAAREKVNPRLIIDYVRDRAGLLNHVGGTVFRFPHRTFQEYLAARHLGNDPDELARALFKDVERWREVFLLAGARISKVAMTSAWGLIDTILAEAHDDSDASFRCASLAGQLVIEAGMCRPDLNRRAQQSRESVIQRLVKLIEGGRLPPVERAAAGDWLGHLGDPRRGVGLTSDGLPDISWITVQPPTSGTFWMGDDNGGFKCDRVREPFMISRYPVTVAQYQSFVKDSGGKQPTPDDGTSAPNTPQVRVSWREAMAFCDWMTQRNPERHTITLPSEFEWEYAARGVDRREYPWGPWRDDAANTHESGIGRLSAVGMFPLGRSWCGAADMVGNVWEWCSTAWSNDSRKAREGDAGDAARVVRGGSWIYDREGARAAYRYRSGPHNRNYNLGFRVCVSPFSPSAL